MKKLMFSAMTLLAFGFANAQETEETVVGFSKGDLFISGSANYNSTTGGGTEKMDGFKISPRVGYFVNENIAAGLGLGYGQAKQNGLKNRSFSAEVFGRYYVTPKAKFSIFGELAVAYTANRAERPFTSDVKTDIISAIISPGLSYFVSKDFALELSLGALGYTNTNTQMQSRNQLYELGIDLQKVKLGVLYKF